MLAMAYLNFGDWHRYAATTAALETLTPHTPEDYLFKGYAYLFLDFEKALENANEAVKLSKSPLARAVRAHIRKLQAEDRADPDEAKGAMDDVQAAKAYLPNNPYVLSVSVWVHVVAANLYLEAGKPDEQQSALRVAKRDAQDLKPWDTLTFPFESLWVYFEQTEDEPRYFDLARRAAEKSDAPVTAYHYALALHRRGECQKAMEVLNRRKWNGFAGNYVRACLVAELNPHDRVRAREACEEIAKQYESEELRQELLRFLGYKDDAIAASRVIRQQLPPLTTEGTKRHWDFNCGDISASEYLKACGRSKWARCGAHYHIALTRLAEGDRQGARDHFRKAVQTKLILNYVADFSRSFLARMETDPTWPPWIPLKKDQPSP
jgi:hypothetical protein